ncbi:MAG: molybdopterin-guanine dinucleotide biosynthesis protein B [Cypionkella sp.]
MRVYGVIGWKNAGKTGLMERLVAEITARGFTVSTVKHVHHDVDLDQPGKDSFRHRAAGASEVVLASAHRFALMHEHRGPEPELPEILARMAPVDLVLVEGYKRDAHAKIEVFRREAGHDLIQPHDPLVRAVASDAALSVTVPLLDLNDTAAIADFILAEVGLQPKVGDAFDTVVVVDWSASSGRGSQVPSKDAIWIGCCSAAGQSSTYCRSRAEAETFLTALLDAEAQARRRVLVGFDFAFGYPAGFAKALTGTAEARAVWAWLAAHIRDDAHNRNNRFEVAAQINAAVGPLFWARPAALDLPALPATKRTDYSRGIAERRQIETLIPRAQPVWKLFTTGAVGSQSLMGLPLIHRLSHRAGTCVWPFDRPTAQVVLAEVYPSLLARAVSADPATIKDEAQVRLLARALFNLSQQGRLAPLFEVPEVAVEEGWILGAGHAAALDAAL